MEHQIETYKKLSAVIDDLFGDKSRFTVTVEELQEIYFEKLSEVLQISFDASLDFGKDGIPTIDQKIEGMDMLSFIVKKIHNIDTYKRLNFIALKFIQSCLLVMHEEKISELEDLMEEQKISKEEILEIQSFYQSKPQPSAQTEDTQTQTQEDKKQVQPDNIEEMANASPIKDEGVEKTKLAVAEVIMKQLRDGNHTYEESREVSRYVLSKSQNVHSGEDLESFLLDISSKWPEFEFLYKAEQARKKEINSSDEIASIRSKLAQY